MSLILGKKGIRKLMAGYPTVTDKYDVVPATLEAGEAVNGDVMMFGSEHSLYKVASGLTAAKEVAGVLLATNVKVPTVYPASMESVRTLAGEQFNLIVRGFVAVELDASAVVADVVEGAPVHVTAAGKITTVVGANIELPWKFTGVVEEVGVSGQAGYKVLAEIVL